MDVLEESLCSESCGYILAHLKVSFGLFWFLKHVFNTNQLYSFLYPFNFISCSRCPGRHGFLGRQKLLLSSSLFCLV